MFRFLKNIFKKKRYEYLYCYVLTSEVYGSKENIRFQLNENIKNDLKRMNKEMVDYDIYTDKEFFESVLILATDDLDKEYFKPLLLEVYAFMKKNKYPSIFSYKYTTLLFRFFNTKEEERFITVYKFKIEC